jgi:deoxyribose-phosphate aldolase
VNYRIINCIFVHLLKNITNMILKYNKYVEKINENYDNIDIMKSKYNELIDYTLLEPTTSNEDIISLTEKARIIVPKSICVLPKMVSLAKKELKDTNILVCTVISFPDGNNTIEEKSNETLKAIQDGADEIDMVLNYKLLKERWFENNVNENIHEYLIKDIKTLSRICHDSDVILKVIVESGLLDIPQTNYVTKLCLEADADYIKTSTGKISIGAELDKVKEMKDVITESDKTMFIKVSGGIRTLEDIEKFAPYVDRFGVGYSVVEQLNGITTNNNSNY